MKHKTLRVPSDLAEEITRRARIRAFQTPTTTALLIERGLLDWRA